MPRIAKGLICDLDGVLRHWPSSDVRALEARHGLAEGALLGVAFEPNLLREAVTGAISDVEWRQTVADRLADEYGVDCTEAVRGWSALRATIDERMLELVREVRAEHPVVLLTNATTRLDDDLAAVALTGSFDAIVNSSDVGVAKPDPEVFRRAAAALDLPCRECAFVDDTVTHVEAAKQVGLLAILHHDAAQTRRALEEVGLVA
jgi:putative hydrolase of the HAD superfamily